MQTLNKRLEEVITCCMHKYSSFFIGKAPWACGISLCTNICHPLVSTWIGILCGCTKTKANFDKQLSARILRMAAQPPPHPIPTDKGRDGDHPRTKASPAPPQAPPGRRH